MSPILVKTFEIVITVTASPYFILITSVAHQQTSNSSFDLNLEQIYEQKI